MRVTGCCRWLHFMRRAASRQLRYWLRLPLSWRF
nr:MAG TPA: hypothetical protein [Caudoviricetes sp.]